MSCGTTITDHRRRSIHRVGNRHLHWLSKNLNASKRQWCHPLPVNFTLVKFLFPISLLNLNQFHRDILQLWKTDTQSCNVSNTCHWNATYNNHVDRFATSIQVPYMVKNSENWSLLICNVIQCRRFRLPMHQMISNIASVWRLVCSLRSIPPLRSSWGVFDQVWWEYLPTPEQCILVYWREIIMCFGLPQLERTFIVVFVFAQMFSGCCTDNKSWDLRHPPK